MTDGESIMSLLVSRKERGTNLEGSHLLKTPSPFAQQELPYPRGRWL